MKRTKTSLFQLLVLYLLIPHNVSAQAPAETVPAFTFYKLDKTTVTANDLVAGKYLFFLFFDVSCEHCQHAVQYLDQHYEEFKNTTLYLVSLDSPEQIKLFMKTYGSHLALQKNVMLMQDAQNQFISLFRPRRYPSLYLYSPQKKLVLYEDNEQTIFRFSKALQTAEKKDKS